MFQPVANLPPATLHRLVAHVGNAAGSVYQEVPDGGRYPRIAFFDTAEHLSEPWQIWHSVVVAGALGRRLNRPVSSAEVSRYLHARLVEPRQPVTPERSPHPARQTF